MTTISIIGSAGRGEDSKFMTKTRFENIVLIVEEILVKSGYKWDSITLQSGGAAFIDHVAVALAIKHKCKLNLCLPCEWVNHQYIDTGSDDWRTNPGRLANKYHQEFSKIMGTDTLLQIEEAKPRICVYKGFHARNKHVAKCDIMIAFTSSTGKEPEHGGTFHTWGLCTAYKVHIPLGVVTG
jgi:hypothetical protein